MLKDGKNSVSVFTVKKKHAWREQLLRWVGLFLTAVVLIGTAVWFFVSANFSFRTLLNTTLAKLSPEIKKEDKIQAVNKEDELREIIEKDKVVEIESISRTTEGDISLKAKNGPQVFFAIKKSLTDQVSTLQTLLTKAKIDNKAVKKVDFRFEKVVVEY